MKEIPPLTKKQLRRFESKIRKTENCWFWIGGTDDHGYGILSLFHISYRAHRVSFWVFNNVQPTSLILHICNNTRCVNPNHLIDGTQKENMQHASSCGNLGQSKGESHYEAKLTEDEVRTIRKEGLIVSGTELARRYNMDKSTICEIIRGRAWSHVK